MSNIDSTFDRYCEGEDVALNMAQDALVRLHNNMASGKVALNWPTLHDAERNVLRAALEAGYRMALKDVRASLVRRGG